MKDHINEQAYKDYLNDLCEDHRETLKELKNEEQQFAKELFKNTLDHFNNMQIRPIQKTTEEIAKKHNNSIYDIVIALNYHIEKRNLFLTIYHGKVMIQSTMI